MSARLQTVHVRVNDADTGQAVPVRIRFSDAHGNVHAPFGRLAEFATETDEIHGGHLRLGKKSYYAIDGACEIDLPPGPITVEVSRGFEYEPLRHDFELTAGKLALRLEVKRWADLRAEGWYAGDGRAHLLTPHAALLEGAAEDLAVVNLLALEWQRPGRTPVLSNIIAFSGQEPALQRPGHMVVVNTLNTCPLGELALLNCHRVVHPLTFQRLNWTMADWCGQCHRKGGLVALPEREFCSADHDDDRVSEGLADLILGKVDVLEVDLLPWNLGDGVDWYTLLNAGLHVPLLGASRKRSNTTALGCVRTYARLQPGEEFTYKNWIEAVRAGRTFVSNGPLLFFSVNGHGPGATVAVDCPTLQVRAQARSQVAFERLEVIHNGKVVAEQAATGDPSAATIEMDLPVTDSGWWAARCWGKQHVHSSFCPQTVGAHTSPIYVNVAGRPPEPSPDAVHDLLTCLERFEPMMARFSKANLFESDHDRERLAEVFVSARGVLQRKLGAGR